MIDWFLVRSEKYEPLSTVCFISKELDATWRSYCILVYVSYGRFFSEIVHAIQIEITNKNYSGHKLLLLVICWNYMNAGGFLSDFSYFIRQSLHSFMRS